MPKQPTSRFALRFEPRLVRRYAARFGAGGDEGVEAVAARARENGLLTRDDFLTLCEWKSPRARPRFESNSEEFVRAVTGVALTTPCEQLRVSALTLLDGVSWPTASVILHFCHPDPYPVLDVRAIWSLGVEGPIPYNFALWSDYTLTCRALARRTRTSMRALDRALWQYSKEHQ